VNGTPDERGLAVVGSFEAAYRHGKSVSVAIEEGISFVGAVQHGPISCRF
jgi:hypothetical protein